MSLRASEQGSITGFVAIVAFALVMVAGMAYDGGRVIASHTEARNDASQAARAGAQRIDLTHLRSVNEPLLDPTEAEAAALAYLTQAGATGTVVVEGPNITVTVTRTQPLLILPGADRTIVVRETATAIDEVLP